MGMGFESRPARGVRCEVCSAGLAKALRPSFWSEARVRRTFLGAGPAGMDRLSWTTWLNRKSLVWPGPRTWVRPREQSVAMVWLVKPK
jgi:hypothetical protein